MIRAIAVSILLLIATPALALEDADYSAAVVATAQIEIIPTYETLLRATRHQQESLDRLCNTPSEANLKKARHAFKTVAVAWARVQFITLGPVSEHQRAFRIEYWPDKRNVVGRQLAEVLKKQDVGALEPSRFATTTVGVQGLPALERLLFEDDALAELDPAGGNGQYHCQLLRAIAGNLEAIANDIVTGWTQGENAFLTRLERPSADDEQFPTGRDAAARLLNDLLTASIAMRDMKLLAPLGTSLEKAKGQQAEYWRSGGSIATLTANLAGMRVLFEHDGPLGMLLAAQPNGRTTAGGVLQTINQAMRLAVLGLPLDKAVSDPEQRKNVEALAERLALLRDLLAGPVASTLNLPIGFNALDGD